MLSKIMLADEAAIEDMKGTKDATNNALSVGLGAGDPNQKSDGFAFIWGFTTINMSISIYWRGDFSCFIGPKMIRSSMDWFHQQVRLDMSILLHNRLSSQAPAA